MPVKKPTYDQKLMLRRRGLDPKDYVVVRETYGSTWFLNLKTWKYKIIDKRN